VVAEALPSGIYFDIARARLYGRRAHSQACATRFRRRGFKRLMGTSTPIEIKGVDNNVRGK